MITATSDIVTDTSLARRLPSFQRTSRAGRAEWCTDVLTGLAAVGCGGLDITDASRSLDSMSEKEREAALKMWGLLLANDGPLRERRVLRRAVLRTVLLEQRRTSEKKRICRAQRPQRGANGAPKKARDSPKPAE